MKHTIRKLLLVEDSKSFGRLLKAKLEFELKFEIVWAETLQETCTLLKSGDGVFSIALLDYTLPDAPNGEVIELVTGYGITSIVFTGNMSKKIRETVWSRKVADYIFKDDPNSFEYVISTIRRLSRNVRSKIMIVEDSALFRKLFSDLLYIHQFQVLTAVNGVNALELLKLHPDIKLILTDYNMPKMDGHALCRKVREKYKKEELAIVGVSASNDHHMAANFIKSGANDFIVKESFFIEEFYCRINQSLDIVYLFKETREAAIKDFLTGLYNRRYFFETGNRRFIESKCQGESLVCAMIDIDFFKKVNDTYGHDVGDIVIQQVSALISDLIPENDIVARFGGEEFCVLSFNMKREEATKTFEALRKTIENSKVVYDSVKTPLKITVSIGVCTLDTYNDSLSLSYMVNSADELLYLAKTQGRNRIVLT